MVKRWSRFILRHCVLLAGFVVCLTTQAENLPDPTQPFSIVSGNSQALASTTSALPVLQSIIYGKRIRHAVLDGKVCQEGSTIGRYRIRAIYVDHVVVEADGIRHTLRLFSHKVRYE